MNKLAEPINLLCLCSNPACKNVYPFGLVVTARKFTNNGCISAPCPVCESAGYVPSGSFKKNEDFLLALIRDITYADIHNLQLEVDRYLKIDKSPNAIKKDLKKKFPQYKKVWAKIPQEKRDLILFLGWLLGVLASVSTIHSSISNMSNQDININIINPSINYYYEQDHNHKQENINPSPQIKI